MLRNIYSIMTPPVMFSHGKEHKVSLFGILKNLEIEHESKCVILQIMQYQGGQSRGLPD